jgi:DNA-binding LacI/PurR family transcriptional regulator
MSNEKTDTHTKGQNRMTSLLENIQRNYHEVLSEEANKPKALKKVFLSHIKSGTWKAGYRLPPERELCKTLQTNKYVVVRAMTELMAEGYLQRRQGSGTYVSDSPNTIQRQKTNSVGVLFSNFSDSLTFDILNGIRKKLQNTDHPLVLWGTDGHSEQEAKYLKQAMTMGLSGLLWWPHVPAGNKHLAQELIDTGLPLVLIDRKYEGLNAPVVEPDHYGGMKKGVEYLIRLGHKRIGFITNEPGQRQTIESVQLREKAYYDAMREAGLTVKPEWISELEPNLVSISNGNTAIMETMGYEAAHRLLMCEERPTAIVLLFDSIAPGVLRAIKTHRLSVPNDVSLLGFNDDKIARLMEVPLTTIRYPSHQVGEAAIDILNILSSGKTLEKQSWIIPAELVIRNSTVQVKE